MTFGIPATAWTSPAIKGSMHRVRLSSKGIARDCLFCSAEPSFTPIVINGTRTQAVVFGNPGHARKDDARGLHLPSLSSSLLPNLVYAFEGAKGPAAIADLL